MKSRWVFLAAWMASLMAQAEIVELKNGNSTCSIDTVGACVLSYRENGIEYLWMPTERGGKGERSDVDWQHGGIPIAWPWFGRIGSGDADIHGYAWKSAFAVRERKANSIVLTLQTAAASLEYAVTLEDGLTLRMKTVNTSRYDLPLGQAFHPYFRVGERDAAVVEGVDAQPIAVTHAIDRSVRYGGVVASRTYRLCDGVRKGGLRIETAGLTGVNVWNPGVEKKCPGTIPGDEWRRFVAVEPFVMGVNRFLVLRPNASHELTMRIKGE